MPLTGPFFRHTLAKVTSSDGTVRSVPERMTLAEFSGFSWPDESRWELIWEVPVLAPSPLPQHQRLLHVLTTFLEQCLQARSELAVFAGIDVALEPARSWLIPDIIVVRDAEVNYNARPFRHVPFLAVELLSPSTASLDVGPKRDAYAEAGVPEYWVVDPQTCAVAIHLDPRNGEYSQPPADKDGFVVSPLLGASFRVSRDGNKFTVLRR